MCLKSVKRALPSVKQQIRTNAVVKELKTACAAKRQKVVVQM